MNIPPVSAASLASRHVELSEFVVVEQTPASSTMSNAPEPSVYAQRLERELRNATVSAAPPVRIVKPAMGCVSGTCKKFCDTASLVCGAAAVPSFVFAIFRPWGLVAPAALVVASVVFAVMRGKPTPEMLEAYERRAVDARIHDSEGV